MTLQIAAVLATVLLAAAGSIGLIANSYTRAIRRAERRAKRRDQKAWLYAAKRDVARARRTPWAS